MANKQIKTGYILMNFESEVEEIPLSKQIVIKKITESMKLADREIPGVEMPNWYAFIEGDSPDSVKQEAVRLIRTLRLFKTGQVGPEANPVYVSPSDLPQDSIPNLAHLKPDVEAYNKYYVTKEEVKHLHSFAEKLFKIDTRRGKLDEALAWFNRSIQSSSPRERFLELITTLECLVLGGGSGELRYTLANRIASLNGTETKSYQIFTEVKQLYKMRSDMVHGNTHALTLEKLEQKLPQLEAIVRKSLLNALALKDVFTHKELLSRLDRSLHDHKIKTLLHEEIRRFWTSEEKS